jgi:putative transposase
MDLDDRGQRPRLLIHDRDSKFSRAFDDVVRSDGIRVIRTPVRAERERGLIHDYEAAAA